MGKGTAIFLDTTILIARLIHAPEIKNAIKNRLKQFSFICSGLVARQEFKRRLLKDAKYLLALAEEDSTIQEIQRRLEYLSEFQKRKFRTCFQILNTVDEMDTDTDRAMRLRYQMRYLLRYGLRNTESLVHFFTDSGCACGRRDVTERKGKYDLGPERCSKTGEECRIDEFLSVNKHFMIAISEFLSAVTGAKSDELKRAESFSEGFLTSSQSVRAKDPCSSVGDLVLALESVHMQIPVFYTMNGRESQYLCRALKQRLIVRPANPAHSELDCAADDDTWPTF
jgi:hypothetical protein